MRSSRHHLTLILAGTCILYLFSGCAKAPDQELAAAKAAFKAAQDAEADKYMVNNFQNVKKALEAAEAEITLQNGKFIGRNYAKAKQYIKSATDLATEITAEAPKAKEAMISQIKENLQLSKNMLKETAKEIKAASRSKGKKIIAEMKANLSAAESAAVQAAADFDAGNIQSASEKLGQVQRLIKKITDNLSSSGDNLM